MAAILNATVLPISSVPSYQCKPFLKKIRSYNSPGKLHFDRAITSRYSKNGGVHRCDFPVDFMFGASSSAIQTEGFSNGCRGPSTWDAIITLDPNDPELDKAIDSYHLFKEDVRMLKNMSADCYRFSISWSRILPDGNGEINNDGIKFYNDLINELVNNGIEPVVTLFHYDLPQALQNRYGGFMDMQIVQDFQNFAGICFENFGDRVKYWTTFNEAQVFSICGDLSGSPQEYGTGLYKLMHHMFLARTTGSDLYKAMHHMLLAHATTYKLYRDSYHKVQGGEVGFPMIILGFIPFSSSPCDTDAAKRAYDFYTGWIMNPLTTGDYPSTMKDLVNNLPKFSVDEKELVKGSFDFVTINYYTSRFAKNVPFGEEQSIIDNDEGFLNCQFDVDQHVLQRIRDADGVLIGPLARGDEMSNICPEGLKRVLLELKNNYGNPKTFISENGIMEPKEDVPLSEALKDPHRIKYIREHLKYLLEAIEEGVNVKAYCYWSLLDSLELAAGNAVRMGLHYTDYDNGFKRIPKDSAKWFRKFLRNE